MKDENVAIEYKKSLSLLKEGVISLSSMLNKNHSGELYFGITPDKKLLNSIFRKRLFPTFPMKFEPTLSHYQGIWRLKPSRLKGSM